MTDRELIQQLRSADHMHAATKLLCDEAADRLEALASRPGGWRGIESAPRDGTRFMAYEEADEAKFYPCWWQVDFSYWEGWQNVWDSEPNPTHWMPLPPAPQPDE